MENEQPPPYLEPMPFETFHAFMALCFFISLIFVIIYSAKKGGIREIIENLLLWFLLFSGLSLVNTYPVDFEDRMSGGVFFLAFGLCRIAKHMARKAHSKVS